MRESRVHHEWRGKEKKDDKSFEHKKSAEEGDAVQARMHEL